MTERYLDGQVAIVNAAAGGFGNAVAIELARRGARLVLHDLPSAEDELSAVAARAVGAGGEAVCCPADATVADDVPKPALLAMRTWDRIDVLVNLVGGTVGPSHAPVWEVTPADWQRTIDLNLTAVFQATRAVLPVMMERRSGRIVNTASIAWAGGGNPAYASAKAGIVAFTRTLSQQLAPYDVNVNVVAPGLSRTGGMIRAGYARDGSDVPEERLATIPLHRINEPDDVAATISFLVSPMARNISGQLITVAGGHNPSL